MDREARLGLSALELSHRLKRERGRALPRTPAPDDTLVVRGGPEFAPAFRRFAALSPGDRFGH